MSARSDTRLGDGRFADVKRVYDSLTDEEKELLAEYLAKRVSDRLAR